MNIYVTKNGQQLGPYSLDQARSLVSAGTLQPADLAWYEGLPNWIALQQILGVGGSSTAPARRPVLVWVICLLYFITIPLGILAIAAIPSLLSFASNAQLKAADTIQTQADHTTDPQEKEKLIVLQKQIRDTEAQMKALTTHGPLYYCFSIFSMFVSLTAAILLFRLRRSAYYVFIVAFIISVLGAIYNYATNPALFAQLGSGMAIFSMVVGWGIGIAIILYVRWLARTGILTNGPASAASA